MRVALAQYTLEQSIDENVEKLLSLMADAKGEGADLLILPELCLSPFFPQYPGRDMSRYAISIDEPQIEAIKAACASIGLMCSPNIYLREQNRLFDASLMIDREGNVLGVSKMVHIAQAPGFYEQDYYAPADSGFKVYKTPFGMIGIVVCFDRHLPESIRTAALKGAALILIPTANTVNEPRDVFECELRAAAYQNGVFIAMCNRVGKEGDTTFCGESTVVDPDAVVLAKADDREGLLVADIDLSKSVLAQLARPYLSLRRTDFYA